jgi:hypothetical protein
VRDSTDLGQEGRMRRVRLLMLGGLFALLAAPLAIPTPASATLTDPCSAEADVTGDDGTAYGAITPKTNSGVYTVPIKGSASYNGLLVGVQEPEEGRAHDGFVEVALPLGFSVNIKSWSEDDSTKVSDSGTVSWDLPAATPRGVEMTVSGEHHDPLGPCSGSITVKLDGGLLDSAVGVATAVGTVLLAAFTLLTGIPTKP